MGKLAELRCFVAAGTLCILTLLATGVIHYLSWSSIGVDLGLFTETQGWHWNATSPVCLTETSWLFYVGASVWLLQLPWLVYALTLACRKTPSGGCMYTRPPALPASVHLLFTIGLCFTIGWIFLWETQQHVKYAVIMAGCASVFLYASLSTSAYKLFRHSRALRKEESMGDIWAIRILVQNGIGTIATFVTIILFYNISAVLEIEANVSDNLACYIEAALLFFYIVTMFAIDMMSLRNMRCSIILPYILVIIISVSVIVKNRDAAIIDETIHLVCGGALLGITVILLVVKIGIYCGRRSMYDKLDEEEVRPVPPARLTPRRTPSDAYKSEDGRTITEINQQIRFQP